MELSKVYFGIWSYIRWTTYYKICFDKFYVPIGLIWCFSLRHFVLLGLGKIFWFLVTLIQTWERCKIDYQYIKADVHHCVTRWKKNCACTPLWESLNWQINDPTFLLLFMKEMYINQTLKIGIWSFVIELDLGVPTTCQLGLLLCLNYNNSNKHAYEEDACGYLRGLKNLKTLKIK